MGGSVFRPEQGYVNYRIGLRISGAAVGVPSDQAGSVAPLAVSKNPFMGATEIRFQMQTGGRHASVVVFDAAGREVRRLFDGSTANDVLRLEWDGRSDAGHEVAPGVYFVRARTDMQLAQTKLVRLQ